MNILVLGASGMAGHVIAQYLTEQGHHITALAGHKKVSEDTIILDLLDKNALDKFLDNHTYDVVVNAVGVLIKQSESRKDLASYLNGFLPHYLEQRFAESQTKLVHLSTDCVFSGAHGPYEEASTYDGETFYDRSKALGEVINGKDLTFRMSIIGPDINEKGEGLFNWFEHQSGTIFGFPNAIWNGITTIELAKAIAAGINQNLTGLYHLVPQQETISKLDLLRLFKQVFTRSDVTIEPKEAAVSSNKTLINTRTDFDYVVPDYQAMITEMKTWITKHSELYPHYQ
ncbi:MAG: SDR family oxidoreductase [Candidatus Saccharibacteria bacterium]